ncbi:toll/interleukin-1 receptor domain-containing protein, partial [Frankia sp. AiPs1]
MAQRWDFFISYTAADQAWAEWIAWELEDAGYQVLVQVWDFVPGSHWTTRMSEAIQHAERTVAVLSHAYLTSVYGQQEWEAALRADPRGFERKLIPVRVEDCPRPGLLGGVVSFDLFDYEPDAARQTLRDNIKAAMEGRGKPAVAPAFPASTARLTSGQPSGLPVPTLPDSAAPPSPAYIIDPSSPTSVAARQPVRRPHVSAIVTSYARAVHGVAFTPDGELLATASPAKSAQLLDVADPTRPRHLTTLTGRLTRLAGRTIAILDVTFSPYGDILATASWDKTARLWDVADPTRPRHLTTLTGHSGSVEGVAFAPNGALLATASADKTARLWDVSDSAGPLHLATLTGHAGVVREVAFTTDGDILATASWDKTARLWDVTDPARPRHLTTLTGHSGGLDDVAFAPSGAVLATASADKTVQLW